MCVKSIVAWYGSIFPLSVRITHTESWSGWQELNLRGHVPKTCGWPLPYTRTLAARHGIEPCPPAFQTSTLPSSSRAKILVDGARIELAFHGCRPCVIPLYEPPKLGRDERIELS